MSERVGALEAPEDRREGDRVLRSLGLHRIPVPVPFPQAGGPVNVIVAEEDGGGLAFVDTGIATPEGVEGLASGLAIRGWSFSEARRILLTHGHVDHFGQAQAIREASGASVRIHPADRRKVVEPEGLLGPEYVDFLRRVGADPGMIEPMLAVAGAQERFARRVAEPVGDLKEGETYRFARCEATVLEMPGHTPGLCCFLCRPRDGAEGPAVLIASDMLLERVSPNPLLELGPSGARFPALPMYLQSLRRLTGLDVDWIVPGHGSCFRDYPRVIRDLEAFYEKRLTRVMAVLLPEGLSPAGLAARLFPQGGPVQTFLMIGEVLGYLDLLEERGLVVPDPEAEVLTYRPTRP